MRNPILLALFGLLLLSPIALSAQTKSFSDLSEQERAGLVQFYGAQWGAVVDPTGLILTTADALSTPYFDFRGFAKKQTKGDSIAFAGAASLALPWQGEWPKCFLKGESAGNWMYLNDLTVVATGHLNRRPWVLLQSKVLAKKSKATWPLLSQPLVDKSLATRLITGPVSSSASGEWANHSTDDLIQAYNQLFSMVSKANAQGDNVFYTYQKGALSAIDSPCPISKLDRASSVATLVLARGTAALVFASDVAPLLATLASNPADTAVKRQITRYQKSHFTQFQLEQDASLANNAFFLAYNVYPGTLLPEVLAKYKSSHPDLYRATKNWYDNSLFTDVIRFQEWVNAPNIDALRNDPLMAIVRWSQEQGLSSSLPIGTSLVFSPTRANATPSELTQISGISTNCDAVQLPTAIRTTIAQYKKVKVK
jgi:hypothetical protein